LVNETDPIHPLKDVWLRPRRVFSALAKQPIGPLDYMLAAAQGIASYLIFSQAQIPELRMSAWNIVALGPIGGLFGTLFYTFVYTRMGARVGGSGKREEIFHILAYSGVPLVASVLLWILTFILLGEAPWLDKPGSEVDGFVWIVARVQFGISVLLFTWSYLLQVMGFSELLGLNVRKSFALWALGQMVGALVVFFLLVFLAVLFPQLVPAPPN
jgi:hypothetical protein